MTKEETLGMSAEDRYLYVAVALQERDHEERKFETLLNVMIKLWSAPK
jgi:hypothetical protein